MKARGENEPDWAKEIEETESSAFSIARARKLASSDIRYCRLESFGMTVVGCVYPMWGLLLAETIDLFFRGTLKCDDDFLAS
eukprot:scaffold2184_cov128-Cylindrotheca_fusiformis.AAC.5